MRAITPLFLALLTGCANSHLYIGPADGPVATLQSTTTAFDDRDGETLQERYRPTGIDGKILEVNWQTAAINGHYRLLPGPHKIIARAAIRRGGFLNETAKFYGVLNATLVEGKHYRLSGLPHFADNQLELWIEDAESGAKISSPLFLDLSRPVQQPNIVTYPIYIPAGKVGR